MQEKINLGLRLLAIKANLPHGHFIPWVEEKSGLTYSMVQNCMRAAREADEARGEAAAFDGYKCNSATVSEGVRIRADGNSV